MVNLLWTLRKRLNSFMNFFQGSLILLITTVNLPCLLLKKRASNFQQLSFQRIIS